MNKIGTAPTELKWRKIGNEPVSDRAYWVNVAVRIARPVLEALSARQLRATMPVETSHGDRSEWTHLEALGRLLCGLAPWLELGGDDGSEEAGLRAEFAALAREAIDAGTIS